MKINCKKELLYKGFQMLSGIITNITTKPILQNVKIEVRDNNIELYATDLEVGIRYFIPIEDGSNVEDGIIVIPEAKIEGILREWIEEYIEINAENNICNISGKDSSFVINGESDVEQFPVNPQFLEEGYFDVDPYIISQMIKRTIFVVIGERIRYTLSGVLIKLEGKSIEMLATDGRRLSKISMVIDNPSGVSCSCIVPVKGLVQLERVIANDLKSSDEQGLKIRVEDNRILFKSKNFILTAQLIDGKYPDCNKIIPDENKLKVSLDVQKLYSAIKRAAVVTTEGSKLLKFRFKDNKLILTAEVAELGNSRVVMDIDYRYEPFEIGFNPDFIKDVLNVVTNDMITMEFTDQGKAGLIREKLGNSSSDGEVKLQVTSQIGDFIHVVMPISLEE